MGDRDVFFWHLEASSFDGGTGVELCHRMEVWVSSQTMMRDNAPDVILDLQTVEFIDSNGLRCLLRAMELVRHHRGSLALCNVRPSVLLVLELTRTDSLLAIFEADTVTV
jgi:anti-anti-sigma factor